MGSEALNPTEILAALGVHTTSSVTRVVGGTSTALWRVEHSGTISALRVFRPNQQTLCLREIEVMQTAYQAGVCVPQIRAQTVWQDYPALLLEWAAGAPLWDVIRTQPWRIWRLGLAFGEMQAHIHRIPAQANWQHQRADWIEWAGSDPQLQLHLAHSTRPLPMLLHLDYHPLNVLADAQQITGVIDWANTRVGDPVPIWHVPIRF